MSIKELADKYELATIDFLELAGSIGESDLDRAEPGEWSARQIIHHQAHSDSYCLTRIIQVVSEPGTNIRSFSESALVASEILAYSSTPIESSLSLLAAVRGEALRIIRSASDADLKNFCIHSELGEITFEKMIESYTNHPTGHINQIRQTLGK